MTVGSRETDAPRLRSMRRSVRQDTDHKHACHDEGDAKKREGIEALTEHPPGNERDQSDARPGPYGVGDGDRNGGWTEVKAAA